MKAAIASATASVILNRLAVARFAFFTLVTLAGAILAALSGMVWAEASGQTKIMVGLGVLVSWGGAMMAFFDSSIKRAVDGKDPLTGASQPPFATQAQVDAGVSTRSIVSPATLAKTLDPTLPPSP